MLFKKTLMINDIVSKIIYSSIQSALFNILLNKLLPIVSKLFKYYCMYSYSAIFIYLIVAVIILLISYKIFKYFKFNKKSSSIDISSILSRTSDFDFNKHKTDRKKCKSSSNSKKKIFTTDLLSSSK